MTTATAVIVNTSPNETINVFVVHFDGTSWVQQSEESILPGAVALVTVSTNVDRIRIEEGVPVSPG